MNHQSSSKYEPVFLVAIRQEDTTPLLKTGDGASEPKQPRQDAGNGDPQIETPEEVKFDDVNYCLTNADKKNLVIYRLIKAKTIEIMDTANWFDPEGPCFKAQMTFFAAEAMSLLIGCEYKSVILKIEWGSTGAEIVVDDRIEPTPPDTQQDNEVHFQRLIQKLRTLTKDSKECRYALHSFICASEAEGLGTVLMPMVVLIVFRPKGAFSLDRSIYKKTTQRSLLRFSRDVALTVGVEDLRQLDFAKVNALVYKAANGLTLLQRNVD